MTVLSNHRVHSYKATAANYRRDISPKKVPFLNTTNSKRVRSFSPKTRERFTHLLKLVQASMDMPSAPPSSPALMSFPEPSAPPAITYTRTIYVWDQEYKVEIPEGFDIYEGLRLSYPELYTAVINEENTMRNTYPILEEDQDLVTEEDIEAAWAHYDYLEYLYD